MIGRYQMKRGQRGELLPQGVRQDTRKHTRHILRPTEEMVAAYLAEPDEAAWRRFEQAYLAEIEARFAADRASFDRLAQLAREVDVYLGCSCPTKKNPDVWRCHTVLGLRFIQKHYPHLEVLFPRRTAVEG